MTEKQHIFSIMLKQGIPTVRFTAKECHKKTADVVTEFMVVFIKE